MSKICLDTSAYSYFKRDHPEVVAIIKQARIIGIPSIVLGELRTGFLLGRQSERNEKDLGRFLANPVVRILDVDGEVASNYAQLMLQLRRDGRLIPTNDVWIGALAVREGMTILTLDGHFKYMSRVGTLILSRSQE